MKLLVLLSVVAFVAARPDDIYKRYEDRDISEVLGNKRLLEGYGKCFIGTGNCTPEGNDLKPLIPDAIQTDCQKCSEKQKGAVAQFIKAIKEQLPAIFEELKKIHDPEGKYIGNLEPFLEKYGN